MHRLAIIIIVALGLGACAYFEKEIQAPLPGERISVIMHQGTLSPDPESVIQTFKEVKDCRVFEMNVRNPVLFVALDKTGPHQSREFIKAFFEHEEYSAIHILIVLEGHVDVADTSQVMWKFFNNLDPRRDIHIFGKRLGIDVTRKYRGEGYEQDWPDEIVMTKEIRDKVDEKWDSLFKN